MTRITLVMVIALFAGFSASAQIPNFTLLNSIDGKSVSLNDYKSSPGLVIVFVSTSCPYDSYYYNRIGKFIADQKGKLEVVLVNPNVSESSDVMKNKMHELGITSPYLIDKDQALMRSLGATKTPEVFVLKNHGGQFSIFYKGAIDDNAQVETDVSKRYLNDSVVALLAGQNPEQSEVRPVGCNIRKK